MKKHWTIKKVIFAVLVFSATLLMLYLGLKYWKTTQIAIVGQKDSFYGRENTEVIVKVDNSIEYKLICKKKTFSGGNYLDYSEVNYPFIVFTDGISNSKIETEINRLLYEMSMRYYYEELENEMNVLYSSDYTIISTDDKMISIYFMTSIGSGMGRPNNYEDAITISLETGKKVPLSEYGDVNLIMKKISNYSGIIYSDGVLDKEEWLEYKDEFIETWKNNEDSKYYSYYFHNEKLGLLFSYYVTGRASIPLEFDLVLR